MSVNLSDTETRTDPTPPSAPAVSTGVTDVSRTSFNTMEVVKRIVSGYLRPHVLLIVVAILANLLVASTTSVLPFLIQQTGDLVFDQKREDLVIWIALAALGTQIVRAFATYVSNVVMNYVGQRMVTAIQTQLFAKLMKADLGWIQGTHSGRFISTFMTDVIRLRDATAQSIINLTRHLVVLLLLIAYMYYLDWLMAIMATAVIPVAAVFMRRLGRKTRKATNKGLEETGSLSTLILEALGGIRVVKAYGREESEIKRATKTISVVLDHTMRSVRGEGSGRTDNGGAYGRRYRRGHLLRQLAGNQRRDDARGIHRVHGSGDVGLPTPQGSR